MWLSLSQQLDAYGVVPYTSFTEDFIKLETLLSVR